MLLSPLSRAPAPGLPVGPVRHRGAGVPIVTGVVGLSQFSGLIFWVTSCTPFPVHTGSARVTCVHEEDLDQDEEGILIHRRSGSARAHEWGRIRMKGLQPDLHEAGEPKVRAEELWVLEEVIERVQKKGDREVLERGAMVWGCAPGIRGRCVRVAHNEVYSRVGGVFGRPGVESCIQCPSCHVLCTLLLNR